MWKTSCLHRHDDCKQLIWVSSDKRWGPWGTTTLTVTLPYASSDTRAWRNHPVEWAMGIRRVHTIRYVLIRSESLCSLPLFCGLYSMHIDYVPKTSYPGETWQKIEARQAQYCPGWVVGIHLQAIEHCLPALCAACSIAHIHYWCCKSLPKSVLMRSGKKKAAGWAPYHPEYTVGIGLPYLVCPWFLSKWCSAWRSLHISCYEMPIT